MVQRENFIRLKTHGEHVCERSLYIEPMKLNSQTQSEFVAGYFCPEFLAAFLFHRINRYLPICFTIPTNRMIHRSQFNESSTDFDGIIIRLLLATVCLSNRNNVWSDTDISNELIISPGALYFNNFHFCFLVRTFYLRFVNCDMTGLLYYL